VSRDTYFCLVKIAKFHFILRNKQSGKSEEAKEEVEARKRKPEEEPKEEIEEEQLEAGDAHGAIHMVHTQKYFDPSPP